MGTDDIVWFSLIMRDGVVGNIPVSSSGASRSSRDPASINRKGERS